MTASGYPFPVGPGGRNHCNPGLVIDFAILDLDLCHWSAVGKDGRAGHHCGGGHHYDDGRRCGDGPNVCRNADQSAGRSLGFCYDCAADCGCGVFGAD